MSSINVYVSKLLGECGRTDADTRKRIDQKVREIGLEMLIEADAKFAELARMEAISLSTSYDSYKLPPEFFSCSETHEVLDSDGEYDGILTIIPQGEMLRRKLDDDRYNARWAYLEIKQDGRDGKGWYLCLGDEPTETMTLKFIYFRSPTEDDIATIKKESMLMAGVRASLPDLFEKTALYDLKRYTEQLGGYSEKPTRYLGKISRRPSHMVRKKNRLMHQIGRGE